jgi:dienelactone hydrolase
MHANSTPSHRALGPWLGVYFFARTPGRFDVQKVASSLTMRISRRSPSRVTIRIINIKVIMISRVSMAAVAAFAVGMASASGVAGITADTAGSDTVQTTPAAPAQGTGPFVPQPILPGGQIVTLFPVDSPYLHKNRIAEPEQNNLQRTVPGRIQSIVNIHNPSIEVHVVDPGNNTGAAIILAPGGGHNTLNVGTEGADFVSYFYNYGVTTIILRNRLRRDGYDPLTDEVNDAQQAIRLVRSRAQEWNIDPKKIGMMGFSAGAELVAPAAIAFDRFDQGNKAPGDPLAGVSSRPDFVALVYPGPTPFARDPKTAIPANAPPAFITCAGAGDAVHAVWADEYFSAMLKARVPNVEMHIYGNGVHGNGLKARDGAPFGTWQDRFIDWFRDLGFLGKPGVETKAARDVAAHVTAPPSTK